MKKQLFCLLLLASLLVTSLSAISVSATEGEVENTTEYYKWYVGAEYGPTPTDANVTLAGNFTAFANEDNSEGAVYNPTGKGGTPWYNKVAGGDQLYLYSTKQWGPATDEKANGGGLNAGAATRANVTDSGDKGIRMEGGKTWLNSANVLVETSFVYVGTTGSDWSVADTASTTSKYENFRFGSLRGHLFPRFTGSTSYRLIEVWRAQNSVQTDNCGQNTNIRDVCGGVENFAPAGLTLYMQKTTETDAGTDYITYAVSYNNGLKKASSAVSDTGVSYAGGAERISVADDNALWTTINGISSRDYKCTFFVRTQCDVYTLRAYTGGVLTQAEKTYNHFIDLLGFYQVAIPTDMTAQKLMAVAPQFSSTPFVYGTKFTGTKLSLEDALNAQPINYHHLYAAQDHLLGLYTSFFGDHESYDLSVGKWHNKMDTSGATDIVIRSTDSTFKWESGILGRGGIALTGVTSGKEGGTTYGNHDTAAASTGLDLPIAWAAKENLTVEASSIVYGAPNPDATEHSWPYQKAMVIDMVGAYYTPNVAFNDRIDGSLVWRSNTSTGEFNTGYKDYTWRDLYDANDGTAVGTTLYVTKKTTHISSSSYRVSYEGGHNVLPLTDSYNGIKNPTFSKTSYENAVSNGKREFRLFSGVPADVYAIRVYDTVLTKAQLQYNHLIDLLSYYRVRLPDGMSEGMLMNLAPSFADVGFVYENDSSKGETDYDEVKARIAAACEKEFYKYYTFEALENGDTILTAVDPSISGDVTLPASLGGAPITAIGPGAFSGCTALTGIELPDTVTSIGDSAFSGCTALTSIVIPDAVKSIGASAFSGCTSLTSITIPFLGEKAEKAENTHFGYLFGAKTAADNKDAVPSGLKSVVVTGGKRIESCAFLGCEGIRSITLPDTVTRIDSKAFSGCVSLTSIELPDTVTSIEKSAFHNTGYYYDESNWENGVFYVGNFLFETKSSLSGAYTVRDGTVGISEYAFENCVGLTEVTLPQSLTSIGSYAFSGCTGLTSLHIPSAVKSIGYFAFSGCTGLTSITVEAGNSVYHSAGNCLIQTAVKTLIQGCSASVIPTDGSVTSIGDYAFAGHKGLASITIPNGVKSIGEHAFTDCSGLKTALIPSSVTSIGNRAFSGCANLKSIELPDGLKRIGNYAFYGCTKLSVIAVPASVTRIGEFAFAGCASLTDLTVEGGNAVYHSDENCLIETAKGTLLQGCNTSVIPTDGSVTSIADYAFYYCADLANITVPACVTHIGKYAFLGCAGLTDITVEGGNPNYHSDGGCLIETATGTLLQGCNTSVIPTDGSVTSIADYAFAGCTNLSSITIPACVTSIGKYAFAACGGLTGITVENGNPTYRSDGNCLIETATGTLLQGCSASVIPTDGSVTSIADYAFLGCYGLTRVTVPACVTTIGKHAFAGCVALMNISVESGNPTYHSSGGCLIETATGTLLQGCNTSVIPTDGSVTSIGDYAFAGCVGLPRISIPTCVTDIGKYAFYYCKGLTDVYYDGTQDEWVAILFANNSADPTCFGAKLRLTQSAYTYTFLDDDGKELKKVMADYGTTIIAPADPTKEATAQYTYTFAGFEGFTAGMTLIENVTFRAKYNATVNQYTYTFFDEDGTTVLGSATADYGAVIAAPNAPTKASTAQYTYSFAGFEGYTAGMTLKENLTFTAVYTETVNTYTYTFFDEDGTTVLHTATVDYGTVITAPTAPTKAATAQYSYTFAGFEGYTAGMTLTENLTFTAMYTENVRQYTYTFYDEDGTTVLSSATADYGTVITAPTAPTKAATAQYTYTFAGFEGFTAGMTLTKNVTFTAKYDATVNQYTYTFYAENGTTVLSSATVNYGTVIVAPTAPSKAPSAQYTYTPCFEGFTVGMTVTDNVSFTLKYEAAVRQYTYTFFDENGTELKKTTADYGATIVAPTAPTKAATAQYTYTLAGFEGFTAGMTLTENVTFTAKYDATVNKYTYTFYDEDGTTVLGSATVDYGTVIAAPTAPTKAATAQYSYTFAGFEGYTAGMTLTENVTFTAKYDATVNKYTYTFYAENGTTVLSSATVNYGTVIVAPTAPSKAPSAQYTYTPYFEGFTVGMTVTDNVSFTLKYEAAVRQYTYTFFDEDGTTVLSSATVNYGTAIAAPAAPTKAATAQYTYTFAGFEGYTAGMTLTENVTFTAKYDATVNKYTYTFFGEDGTTVLSSATVNYGTVIVAPTAPTKAEDALYTYTFAGFDGFSNGMTVTGNASFTATYTATLKGVLALQSTVTETAWGLELVTSIAATQTAGTGGHFTLVLDELTASFVSFEAAEGVTVEKNGNEFTVTVTRAVEENELLLTLTLKTSDFLASGEHAFLSLAESETATATFAPIVIHEIGDVDGNGTINVLDALLLKQHLVEIVTLDSVQLAYADADPDGVINILDAMYIEQFIVEIRDTLGDRVEVVFVTETEDVTYTVVAGEDLTAVPEAPEGFLWSADTETYVPPVFTCIVNEKTYYYLVKE